MNEALLVLALALFAQLPDNQPAPRDSLRYAVGGTMSGPMTLDIHLDDGSFTLTEPAKALSKELRITQGRVGEPTIQHLRSLAGEAMRDGFIAARCRTRDYVARIPTDAMRDLTVRLDGRVGSSPNDVDCWSDAAQALSAAAMNAAHGR
jgi:hypothetical protein